MKKQMDRKREEAEVVRCRRALSWGGGMTRQRREIELVRWKEARISDRMEGQVGAQTRWGRDSKIEEEAKISDTG